MNKPVLGLVAGGVLGIFDGLTALISAPEVAPRLPVLLLDRWARVSWPAC